MSIFRITEDDYTAIVASDPLPGSEALDFKLDEDEGDKFYLDIPVTSII